jgi:hypothetical protein
MSVAVKDDIGTIVAFDVGEDITTATLLRLEYQKPDNKLGSWVAGIYGTTSAAYVTLAGDLNVAGRWKLQAYIELPGWKGHSTVATFDVEDELLGVHHHA